MEEWLGFLLTFMGDSDWEDEDEGWPHGFGCSCILWKPWWDGKCIHQWGSSVRLAYRCIVMVMVAGQWLSKRATRRIKTQFPGLESKKGMLIFAGSMYIIYVYITFDFGTFIRRDLSDYRKQHSAKHHIRVWNIEEFFCNFWSKGLQMVFQFFNRQSKYSLIGDCWGRWNLKKPIVQRGGTWMDSLFHSCL